MKYFYKSKLISPLNSIQDYDADSLPVFEPKMQERIEKISKKLNDLNLKTRQTIDKKSALIKQLQNKCQHEECLEEETTYRDEYDSYHDGPKIRFCIKCFYKEAEYGYSSVRKNFEVLKNSKIVRLYKIIDNKKYELEIKDLEIK